MVTQNPTSNIQKFHILVFPVLPILIEKLLDWISEVDTLSPQHTSTTTLPAWGRSHLLGLPEGIQIQGITGLRRIKQCPSLLVPELFYLESDNPTKFSTFIPTMQLTEKNCFRKMMSTFTTESWESYLLLYQIMSMDITGGANKFFSLCDTRSNLPGQPKVLLSWALAF